MAAMPMLGMFGGNFASATVNQTGDVKLPDAQNDFAATESVLVKVTQPSEFTVTIPKEITLDNTSGSDYASKYTVKVAGDIAGTQTVTVEPAVTSFELTQNGKTTKLTANVAQDKKEVTGTQLEQGSGVIEMKDTGTVTATNVKAGTWNGTFNFNINLQ